MARSDVSVVCECGCGISFVPTRSTHRYLDIEHWRKHKAQEKKAKEKAWYQANKKRKKATADAWRERNPDRGKKDHARRKAYIRSFKTRCEHCGGTHFAPEELDFHHRDPKTKRFTLASAWRRSYRAIDEEIAKCIVLCKVCHRNVHELMRAEDADKLDLTVEYWIVR